MIVDKSTVTLDWVHYKSTNSYVGFYGKRVLAIIDKAQGLPCEAYNFTLIGDCYVDVESAKEMVEKIAQNTLAKPDAFEEKQKKA